ncbi:septal ring lytic transglycosylase RlpA family protein [Geomonas sp. RF6]|uniref:septal ring lytic transglycosylase RlpA family protein n=1 Tax=Geomonas sp. RF6 TaxID=2897342 RepID=UPI001E45C730|nr:septal ring lytic transglycosylase RlpA family protein [Geomonas sp. RF6]UFS71589.1 septal ring lytic transglycosylase RlpA family protein [Geomonas sp. RF6]
MASPERSGKMAVIGIISLLLLPIHTLPLLAAEKVEKEAEPKVEKEEKKSVVKRLIGLATYYAKRYNGRRTSSGARHDPEEMTAAHHNLPLGTRVRVTNLANNKEVTVVINDRCRKMSVPFIDLSRAAARKLGFLGAGRANVAISLLAEGES